jgi:DNA-binding NtrC family response regulator
MKTEKSILLVEPDQHTAKRLDAVLQKEKFKVYLAERGSETIRYVQQEHVSVLILDTGIKDMKWEEVVPIVKGFNPGMPIIMTSDANTPELESMILHHKVFYYHIKSFGNDELVLAVRNAVERHAQQDNKIP